MSLLTLLVCGAWAQGLDQHHPEIPASSVATENGPGALWVNPANLGFDPDPRVGFFYEHEQAFFSTDSVAATVGVQGLQAGLHHIRTYDPATGSVLTGDWSLDYGTSIPLPERLSIGVLLSWNFIDGGTNYVGYDAGVSWRPLYWFGMAATAQNAGGPDPSGIARPRTTGGIALRPLGDFATIGLDYGRTFATDPVATDDQDSGRVALRLRPVEGLYLRASTDLAIDPQNASVGLLAAGAGIEVYFDGVGGGLHGQVSADAPPSSWAWFGTDEPGDSLIRSGRKVEVLDLDRSLPYEPRPTLLVLDPGPSYIEVMERLRRAQEDPGVKGLLLNIRGAGLSWAQWQELRQRVQSMRDNGKVVVAYLDGSAGNGAYFLATACDRIYLHPAAEVGLVGISGELQNLRGLLDLVGVEPQFVRRSEYKSAPEMFTNTEPSAANLEATNAYIDDLFEQLAGAVAERVGKEDAVEVIDQGPWTAKDAREANLVDGLLYPSELEKELESLMGGFVDRRDLLTSAQAHYPWDDPAKIALVYVDGAIVDGESSSGGFLGSRTAGADTVARSLRKAKEDPTVRAVVLRVDSPGGSALASDRIWQAVEQVQEEGKPVIVSMGGLAASGGYYVSAGADAIFAEPGTLTGSIGVYGGKFSTAELMDTIGVNVTPIQRGRHSDLYSGARPWDDVQRAKVQSMVDETYRRFKKVVGDGRGMTSEEVEEVARGRVWTGVRAKEIGLVDELGNLQDAVLEARDRAGIRPNRKVGLVSYSESGSLLESFAPGLLGEAADRVLGPFDDWARASKGSALRTELGKTPELHVLDELVPELAPFVLLQASHPDTVLWMMDPWLVDPTTR